MACSPEQHENAVARASKIYTILKAAAESREVCPTNDILAERFGCGTTAIVNALHFLEANGMIQVERGNCNRVVTILATGKTTAGKVRKPHWMQRRAA